MYNITGLKNGISSQQLMAFSHFKDTFSGNLGIIQAQSFTIQCGFEYRTYSDLKWLQLGRMLNGSVFYWSA